MKTLLFFQENRNFQRLWLAQLISQFGDRIHQLALVGLIAVRAPGSTMGLAKLLTCTILPVFIVQPFASVFVDRWDRRTILFACDLIRGALVILIPLIFIYWNSIIPIYIIVFLAFCFSRFYVPAKMSIIPDLVSEESLIKANSLVTTTGMIAFVLGCAIGGFLIEYVGPKNGFFIDAVTFFLSASILFSMDLPKKFRLNKEKIVETTQFVRRVEKSVFAEIKEGFVYLVNHREIRFIIKMLFVLLAAAGSTYVVIIVFIQQSFHSLTKDLGILAVCFGAGLFMGVVLYGRFGKKFLWYKTIFFCLALGGVMLTVFAYFVSVYSNLFWAVIMSAVLGFVIGPIFIASNTIVHVFSDDAMRGKVFGALEMVIHFAFLTAMLLSSWLSEFIPREWILTGVGVTTGVIGLYGLLRVRFDPVIKE